MPETKAKNGDITDLSKHRKRKRFSDPKLTVRIRPDLQDVPGIVVRVKDRPVPIMLLNLPAVPSGVEMLLRLIALHPDMRPETHPDVLMRLGDIQSLERPTLDGLAVIEAKRRIAPAPPGAFNPIQVRMGMRQDVRVGLFNIPESPEGWALFYEILGKYAYDRDGFPSGYTLYTTDYGIVPVHEFARDNPLP